MRIQRPLLEIIDLETAYGRSQVLFGLCLSIGEGEVAALVGRNGMGKTTTIRSLFGIAPIRAGSILFEGQELRGLPPYAIAARGLGLVPEGRQIFPNLTVQENLTTTASRRSGGWTVPRIFSLFPQIEMRQRNLGKDLSGGEQQMLAIGRALMTNPKLLILDEATEGLAPIVRSEIWRTLEELKRSGLAILVIDKDVDALSSIADRFHIIEKGRIEWQGTAAELLASPDVQERHLSL